MWMKWAINVDNMRYKFEFSENMWMQMEEIEKGGWNGEKWEWFWEV